MKNNEVLQSILYCNQLKRIHRTQPAVLQTQVQLKDSQGYSQCFKSRAQSMFQVKGTVKGTANVTFRGYSQSTVNQYGTVNSTANVQPMLHSGGTVKVQSISMAQLIVQPMYSQCYIQGVQSKYSQSVWHS